MTNDDEIRAFFKANAPQPADPEAFMDEFKRQLDRLPIPETLKESRANPAEHRNDALYASGPGLRRIDYVLFLRAMERTARRRSRIIGAVLSTLLIVTGLLVSICYGVPALEFINSHIYWICGSLTAAAVAYAFIALRPRLL